MSCYEDIIDTQWPRDSFRDKMPLNQRAKIFLPFAALTGYEQSLEETLALEIKSMERKLGNINFESVFD